MAHNIATVDCWIGLNDIDTEGMFVWADGSSSSYRNWGPGQPDNSNEEDCVHLRADTLWNDLPCGSTRSCHYCGGIGKYVWYAKLVSVKCVTSARIIFIYNMSNILRG